MYGKLRMELYKQAGLFWSGGMLFVPLRKCMKSYECVDLEGYLLILEVIWTGVGARDACASKNK